ncbi:hypothetical protein QBC33DRAFT_555082 [Phialemonium atrogriseum]|uniref:Uncharacterized protein n=1 Tax=Phialemonium atrogriseum TaxID=1093897 RepID=A0AAJ0FKS9_9PEZI|nr:uncharacterized protein QBC33DRAFT_555082 [Phialemonium atrogriseum]KAK1771926.1 hypothetical protein QBC33DRAFT_555082 [Phialemonium atrogriseum]
MSVDPKETFQNGMNQVFPRESDNPGPVPQANVVFVHGLFGHPWKTWADKSVRGASIFWPEDLLSKAVQDVRIFSFGYDADVERFMSAAGLNTVHEHGRNLLNDLCDLMDRDFTVWVDSF